MSEDREQELLNHLRTAHFTIALVCAGILLTFFLERSTDTEKAHRQAREIIEALKKWPEENWLAQYTESVVARDCRTNPSHCPARLPPAIKITVANVATPIYRDVSEEAPQDLWAVKEDSGALSLGTFDRTYVTGPISEFMSLADFEKSWDALTSSRQIVLTTKIDSRCFIAIDEPDVPWQWRSCAWEPSSKRELKEPQFSFGVIGFGKEKESVERETGKRVFAEYALIAVEVHTRFARRKDHIRVAQMYIPVQESVVIPFNPQKELISLLEKQSKFSWQMGHFDYTFRELDSVTRELRDLRLDKVERILGSELARSGESIEFFGLKLPTTAIRWGLLPVLVLQVYFWLHLRELARRAYGKSGPWGSAWIAFYEDGWARFVFVTTAFVLPPVVLILLGWHCLTFPSESLLYCVVFYPLAVAVCISLAFLSGRIWRG